MWYVLTVSQVGAMARFEWNLLSVNIHSKSYKVQPFCAWPCPLLNSRPNLTVPLWDIMGMDIALCDITCITGVIPTL